MQSLFEAAADFEQACAAINVRFCFIGGIAVQRWGKARVTRDLDLSVWADFGGESALARKLFTIAEPRIPDAMAFAIKNRVLLLKHASGIEIDIGIAGLPFEEAMIARASKYSVTPTLSFTTCSAEDLVVMKAFANRPRDWGDIEGIVRRQTLLDWAHIQTELEPLAELKEEPEILDALKKLKRRIVK